MTKILKNNSGIALVTSLMMTLISMTIIMSLLYMITTSIRQSGATKRYHTTLEAAYGGNELVIKDILPQILTSVTGTTLQTNFAAIGLVVSATDACLKAKMTLPTANWPAGCSSSLKLSSITQNVDTADMHFDMPSAGATPYTVYTKIVDTISGNTDTSGLQLEGGGVAESQTVITPQHFPFVYRVEVQGQQKTNPTEQANISVLYAY